MPSSSAPIGIAGALLLLLFTYVGREVWLQSGDTLWDFRSYYTAAEAHRQAADPYDLNVLSEIAGDAIVYPYTYPPATLFAFRPFLWLDYETASLVFLALKVLAYGALLLLWGRVLPWPGAGLALLVMIPLAFAGAAQVDLRSGNLAVFEQLLIWLGLTNFMRGKALSFVLYILLAASFKLLPLALLLLVFCKDGSGRPRGLDLAAGAMLLAIALHYVLSAGLMDSYMDSMGIRDERGSINPCSFAFWGSLLHFFAGPELAAPESWLRWLLYLLGACLVFVTGARRVWIKLPKDRLAAILTASLTYALILPRFKDYSYLLLIPAAIAACLSQRGTWRILPLCLLFCLPTHDLTWISSEGLRGFVSYYPLYCVGAVWLYFMTVFASPSDHANQNRLSPR